jgi:D-amino-acid dehydrogenase
MTTVEPRKQAERPDGRHRVVVIGAGIAGAASAVELVRDGHSVTIVEVGEPGGEQAASYGNGAWLSPSSVVTMSHPGLWKDVPGYLLDPLGPLAIRWRYFPRVVPWLLRFLSSGSTKAKVQAIGRALRPLVADAPARHAKLAAEAGVGDLIKRQGLLYVYADRAAFEAEALAWEVRAATGVKWLELDENHLRQREPGLNRSYTFGVLVEEGAHCLDPGAYVAALVSHAVRSGAGIRKAKALGFVIEHGRLRAVRTSDGDVVCDKAVVCAGAWSKTLASAAGDDVVLESERGYHAMIPAAEAGPRYPTMPADVKASITRTLGGLRIAGQVELAGLEAAPNWKRAQILLEHLKRVFPGLPPGLTIDNVKVWMGHRPATPDALPVIARASGCPDIVYGFGHGHIGLAAGAITGRLVADLVGGKAPVIDPQPYSARRFS